MRRLAVALIASNIAGAYGGEVCVREPSLSEQCFSTVQEARAAIRAEAAQAKQAAELLVPSYIDIAIAALTAYEFPDANSYCLYVFGESATPETIAKVSAIGHEVSGCSGGDAPSRSINRVVAEGDRRFIVHVSYSCGLLCAGGIEFTIEHQQGALRATKTKTLWIS